MPTTRVRRTVAAAPGEVWRVVGDPHQLPRWWPRAVRVEGVTGKGFTLVMTSKRGREVRAEQRVVISDRPRRRTWALEVAGTPFERVFAAYEVAIALTAVDGGTEVGLSLDQRMKGASRLGGLLARRAARRQLREALDALEGALAR